MKLVAYPLVLDGVFFFQPVDNALADITEGSDVVGKYFEVDHYCIPQTVPNMVFFNNPLFFIIMLLKYTRNILNCQPLFVKKIECNFY